MSSRIITGLALLTGLVLMSGCGNTYRPVVSAINPVGPAGQPTKYAVAVSNPSTYPNNLINGLLTIVDVSGDTTLSTPSLPGLTFPAPTTQGTTTVAPSPSLVNPLMFTTNSSGTQGFVVNSQGVFEDFGLTNPTGLLTQNITQTSLGATPTSIQTIALPATGTTLFVPQANSSVVSELEIASGPSFLQNLSVGANPIYTVGYDEAQRVYAISQGSVANGPGRVAAIENNPIAISTYLPVGVNPVYGVMTTDDNRAFILNRGNSSNTPGVGLGTSSVTVINVPSNALDAANTTITIPDISIGGGQTVSAHPVWADLSTVNSEMVVLNQGDGIHPGTLSVISIPLCNANTPVTNPNCNAANPVDATGFGTVVGTATVGVNPTMVSVLADGTRAYVVNSGILPGVNSSYPNGIEGSVSVVNLASGVTTATIPATSLPANTVNVNTTPTYVYGHPNTVAATTGNPTGKVYVTSSDNKYMTIIETDTDTVDTHLSLQGLGVRVIVTQK